MPEETDAVRGNRTEQKSEDRRARQKTEGAGGRARTTWVGPVGAVVGAVITGPSLTQEGCDFWIFGPYLNTEGCDL